MSEIANPTATALAASRRGSASVLRRATGTVPCMSAAEFPSGFDRFGEPGDSQVCRTSSGTCWIEAQFTGPVVTTRTVAAPPGGGPGGAVDVEDC